MLFGVIKWSMGIVTAVASVTLQWLMLSTAIINAVFSFAIKTLVACFRLRNPCLLCSKAHWFFDERNSRYYWDLICDTHRREVSALVFSHAHVHETCENGLCSFASINRSNAERSLDGKVGEGSSSTSESDSLLAVQGSSNGHCYCCHQRGDPKVRTQKFMSNKRFDSEAASLDDGRKRPHQRDARLGSMAQPSALREFISLGEVPLSSGPGETFQEAEEFYFKTPDSLSLAGESPHATSKETNSSINAVDTTIQEVKGIYTPGTPQFPAGITPATNTEPSSEAPSISGDNIVQAPAVDIRAAYKLATDNKEKKWTGKDVRRSEDLKNSMTPRVLKSPTPRLLLSPRFSVNADDLSTKMGIQLLQKRLTAERESIESTLSLDGSNHGETDTESLVSRQKQQIAALYKELEEERNASTIAANQAMAMINRLQEEKAKVQMEALQCLRMMEQQAEYDLDALENTNYLLNKKEKEIHELEEELEFYKLRSPTVSDAIDEETDIIENKATPTHRGHERNLSHGSNFDIFYSGRSTPLTTKIQGVNLSSLVKEVTGLSERLKALEADRNSKTMLSCATSHRHDLQEINEQPIINCS